MSLLTDEQLKEYSCQLSDLAEILDAETILQVVCDKILGQFTVFDVLLMHKCQRKIEQRINPAQFFQSTLEDIRHLQLELNDFIQSFLEPVAVAPQDSQDPSQQQFPIDPDLQLILRTDAKFWRLKSSKDIEYRHPFINTEEFWLPEESEATKSPGKGLKRAPEVSILPNLGDIKDDEKVSTVESREVSPKGRTGDDISVQEPDDEFVSEIILKGSLEMQDDPKGTTKSEMESETHEVECDDVTSSSDQKHLCLKCGQTVVKHYGIHHEAKCEGMRVRPPEYTKKGGKYACSVAYCPVIHHFDTYYGIRKHFHECHMYEEEKHFLCDYCDKRFSYRTARNRHVKSVHLKRDRCNICDKMFGGKDKLASHMLQHTGERPFACNKCDYRATKRFNLEKHIQSKHKERIVKQHECRMCQRTFVTSGRLQRHVDMRHTNHNITTI